MKLLSKLFPKLQSRKLDVQKIYFKVAFDDGTSYENVIVGRLSRNAEDTFEDLLVQWNSMGLVAVSDERLIPFRKIQNITFRTESYDITI